MIAKLTGRIDTLGVDHVILDVGGVGYCVYGSRTMLSQCPGHGELHSLMIETHVREDQITLYGFANAHEKSWYKLLTSVQGVGSRVALSILSTHTPDQLSLIIASQDKKSMSAADGVGPKLATRLVTELADKVGTLSAGVGSQSFVPAGMSALPKHLEDAVGALTNLGYARSDAAHAVSKVQGRAQEDLALDQMIREALRELAA